MGVSSVASASSGFSGHTAVMGQGDVGGGATPGTSVSSYAPSPMSFVDLEGKGREEQLDLLKEKYRYEAAIKAGAENMLHSSLNDQLRVKVRAALTVAEDNMDSIKQRIEMITGSAFHPLPPATPNSSTNIPISQPSSLQSSSPATPLKTTPLHARPNASDLAARRAGIKIVGPPAIPASEEGPAATSSPSAQRHQPFGYYAAPSGPGTSQAEKEKEESRGAVNSAMGAIRELVEVEERVKKGKRSRSTSTSTTSGAGTGSSRDRASSTSSKATDTSTMVDQREDSGPSSSSGVEGGANAPTAEELDKQRKEALKRLVRALGKNGRVAYELEFGKLVDAVLPTLGDSASKQCRALGYRAIRLALVAPESVKTICEKVQWFVVKTLTRDNKHALEKEQAIKLIRAVVESSRTLVLPSASPSSSFSQGSSSSLNPPSSHSTSSYSPSSSPSGVSGSMSPSSSPLHPTHPPYTQSPQGTRARGNSHPERGRHAQQADGGNSEYDHEEPECRGDGRRWSKSVSPGRDGHDGELDRRHPGGRHQDANRHRVKRRDFKVEEDEHHYQQQLQQRSAQHSYGLHEPNGRDGDKEKQRERDGERDQRARDESPRTRVHLTQPVMRAVVAVAENAEDPFKAICVQTLAEILLIDIKLMSETGGLRLLLHVLGEGSVEMSSLLSTVFLHIVDSPRTRVYLRSGVDLEIVLWAVTDAYGRGPDHADRMRACSRVIQSMLWTWSGLMYFCSHGMRAIRSLVDVIRLPSLETRDIVLDMFFELFDIKSPEWADTFISGRRLTMYRQSKDAKQQESAPVAGNGASSGPDNGNGNKPQNLKLTDQYIALLIVVFANAGILEALTSMLQESTTGSNLSRKATLLMAEILHISNRVLPLSYAAKLQSIPQIMEMASNYNDGEHRIVGNSALSAIDSFNRNKLRLQQTGPAVKNARQRANSVEDAVRRGQRQVEQVKIKMGMQMDDKAFQAALLETQVSMTKEHNKWNFEVLQDLIEGPLLNPKRMEEAIKVSRFVRRVMQFYLPFAHKFSDMKRTPENQKWVKLGCTLLTTLISSTEGLRYLQTEDPFLPQIVKSFAQLDPFNGDPEFDPIFSKKNIAETLSYGYLEMLGTLSQHKEGIELMEKFKIFTAFYHLSELRSREDLIKGIMENLDYSIDGHPRIVLSKALTSSYKHIRHYATCHLGNLIRNSFSANTWTLKLLLTQLYDPAPEVCEVAVHLLEMACQSQDILRLVVDMQPPMEHLGELGHPLLMKFMSTPTGFRYLYHAGYVDREMDMWFHERNIWYAVQVEIYLSTAFTHKSTSDDILAFEGTVPPHFYGQMAKTDLGCQILQEKGHFTEFVDFIRTHGHECDDSVMIMKLKSILWAVGNIGSTEGGLPFLEENDIVPTILEIAETSAVPSVRGTCFFVLGLISTTSLGAEMLDDYHWESTLSPLGMPTGLCLPVDLNGFVAMKPWAPPESTVEEANRLIPPTEQAEIEVMTAIQNLSNTVIANAASRSLAKLRARSEYKHVFTSPTMFFRALHTISTQRYRLPVRRYILDLFNVEVNVDTIAALSSSSKALRLHTEEPHKDSSVPPPLNPNLVHIIPRPESDEEDEEDDDFVDTKHGSALKRKSTVAIEKLRPVSRIIGFAA